MSLRLTRRSALLGGAALWLGAGRSFAKATARPWPGLLPPRPLHAPRPSDVCFSDRSGKRESLEIARTYQANRLDWCYSGSATFRAQAREAGLSIQGGTLNAMLPDEVGGTSTLLGRALDRAGNYVVPRRETWGKNWACINSPDYEAILLAHTRRLIDAGIDYIQIDDASFNLQLRAWGGCYCPHCQAMARKEGLSIETDMIELQRRSVIQFYDRIRPRIDQLAGRRVTLSANNPPRNKLAALHWPFRKLDFGMAEIDRSLAKPAFVRNFLIEAERAGAPQVFTLRNRDRARNRQLAAWCYANGGHMIVPWDVYIPKEERFSANPAGQADIFTFARSLGRLLDEAVPADDPPKDAWSIDRPSFVTSLRVDPRRSFAIFHLVNWGEEGTSTLSIDPLKLLPGGQRVAAARARPGHGNPINLTLQKGRLTCSVPAATWVAVEMEVA